MNLPVIPIGGDICFHDAVIVQKKLGAILKYARCGFDAKIEITYDTIWNTIRDQSLISSGFL